MKNIIYKSLIIFCLSAFAVGLSAQTSYNEVKAEKMTSQLDTQVSLDDQQRTQVYNINIAFLTSATTLSSSDKVQMQELKENRQADINAVLTAAQRATLSSKSFRKMANN